MRELPEMLQRPELSSDEGATQELVKRIRKLRWMGMDEEAKRLQATLSKSSYAESALLLPLDTD